MERRGRGELDELSPSQPSPPGRALKELEKIRIKPKIKKVSPAGGDYS